MKFSIAALLLCLGTLSAAGAERFYQTGDATCDGWPRASIGMAPGFCAGIVVAPPADFNARIMRVPRALLALPGGKDFLVTDVGKWQGPGGQVFRITAERGQPTIITPIIPGL